MTYTFPRLVKIRPNINLAFGALGRTFAGHLTGILIERLVFQPTVQGYVDVKRRHIYSRHMVDIYTI